MKENMTMKSITKFQRIILCNKNKETLFIIDNSSSYIIVEFKIQKELNDKNESAIN